MPSKQFRRLAAPLTVVVSAGYNISGGIRILGNIGLWVRRKYGSLVRGFLSSNAMPESPGSRMNLGAQKGR